MAHVRCVLGAHADMFEAFRQAATDYVVAQGQAAIALELRRPALYVPARERAEQLRRRLEELDRKLIADFTEDAAELMGVPLQDLVDAPMPSSAVNSTNLVDL